MKLHFEDQTYLEDDMTTAHAILVANLVGQDEWSAIHPTRGPIGTASWLAVLHASRTGEDINTVAERINLLPLHKLLECLDLDSDS